MVICALSLYHHLQTVSAVSSSLPPHQPLAWHTCPSFPDELFSSAGSLALFLLPA